MGRAGQRERTVLMDCAHYFVQKTTGGPIVCNKCGVMPAAQTVFNVSSKNSTTSNVLQGCGCLVIGVILLTFIIVIL